MFRLYSKGCEYTIRALSHISTNKAYKYFVAKEVCLNAGIPESFTRKILQRRVQSGFLKAVTGPGRGYTLAWPPKKISMLSIIKAVDGAHTFERCIMGLPRCEDRRPCPLHKIWKGSRANLLSVLERKTLQDMIDSVNAGVIGRRKTSRRIQCRP